MRLLVACQDIVINGGLLRFDRVAAAIRGWGHELAFVRLSERPAADRTTDIPVLGMDAAASRQWDAVMAPGAGFPPSLFPHFAAFARPNFGIRVQHVLNAPAKRNDFKALNDAFQPHMVIFNNEHWLPGSYTDFAGDRFHVLVGAVDAGNFRPAAYRSHPLSAGKWVIGGLVNKHPDVLIAALAQLPRNVSLRLYGPDAQNVRERQAGLIAAGRLHLAGPLYGADLPRFYRGVDCVVSAEIAAGWANLGAEAMASGVPLICTPHGTMAFARDGATALVLRDLAPAAIAAAVNRLRGDAGLCRRLAEAGRDAIEEFSWEAYSRKLLELLRDFDGQRHYTYAPEHGRFGKWPLSERLAGLDGLLDRAPGLSVLDLGAAEGLVGAEFLKRGARLVHGFELDPERVRYANALCAEWQEARFRAADLSDSAGSFTANRDLLLDRYDLVLYLGLHQHLSLPSRTSLLRRATGLAQRYIAIRSPEAMFEADRIEEAVCRAGFAPLANDDGADGAASGAPHRGPCRIYQRVREAAD